MVGSESRAMVVEVRAESWAWGAMLGVASLTRCMIGVSTDKMGSVGRLRTAIIMRDHEYFVNRSRIAERRWW